MAELVFQVVGMACGGCSATVQQALLATPGVLDAEVLHVSGRARVVYDEARTDADTLRQAVITAGYGLADRAAG